MRTNYELTLSFIVVFFLVGVYVVYEVVTTPAGGHPFGHALGILGAILMLMAETLYTMRKRFGWFRRLGQVRHWLSFHIFTGIVGPALVLMHTGLEFRGLAGLTTLLTILVVASGFLGRYIYTAVPRTLAGVEVDRRTLEARLAEQREGLRLWSQNKPVPIQQLIAQESSQMAELTAVTPWQLLVRRAQVWQERRQLQAKIRRLNRAEQTKLREIEQNLRQHQRLVRQIRSLQTVRRLMGLWHTAHIPLGLTLFMSMTIHIVATIYFGAFS